MMREELAKVQVLYIEELWGLTSKTWHDTPCISLYTCKYSDYSTWAVIDRQVPIAISGEGGSGMR